MIIDFCECKPLSYLIFQGKNPHLLRSHQLELCENKLITCPNTGCNKSLHKRNLSHHLSVECPVAISRNNHLKAASEKAAIKEELDAQITEAAKITVKPVIVKEEDVTHRSPEVRSKVEAHCPLCNELLSSSSINTHPLLCPFRPISCPNFGIGCNQKAIPLCRVQMHLKEECPAEKAKQEMIDRSFKRNDLIQCSTCGYQVELRSWKRHEQDLCENRLVPCKNSHLGCGVLVPLNERHLHESIDENYDRCCVYFSGHGSFMQIEESDVLAPWTAEVSD